MFAASRRRYARDRLAWMRCGRLRMPIVSFATLLLAAPQEAPAVPEPPSPKRRSVLFYLIDTCRADHLSANGYARPTTPFLEELAARGVRFENCFSQAPWTKPSVGSILTSCYP